MFYLQLQIFFSLLAAAIIGWYISRLLYQTRERELVIQHYQSATELKTLQQTLDNCTLQHQQNQQQETENQHRISQFINQKMLLGNKLEQLKKDQQTQQENLTRLNAEFHARLSRATTRRDGLLKRLNSVKLQRDGYKDRLRTALQKREVTDTQLDTIIQERDSVLNRLQYAEQERSNLATETISLSHEKESYHGKLHAVVNERNELKVQIKNLNREREQSMDRLRLANGKTEEMTHTIANLAQERDKAQMLMDNANRMANTLDEEVDLIGKERDELRIRLFTVEELTSRITSPMKQDSLPKIEATKN